MPIHNAEGPDASTQNPVSGDNSSVHPWHLVHWLRVYLAGRRPVDEERLKLLVHQLTERQWRAAVREDFPRWRSRLTRTGFEQSTGSHQNTELPVSPSCPDDVLSCLIRDELASRILEQLDHEEQELFKWTLLDHPPARIARHLGITRNALYKRRRNLRTKIARLLEQLQA